MFIFPRILRQCAHVMKLTKVYTMPVLAGSWRGIVPIPWEKTMEAAETKLEDKTKFLQFMRRTLAWDPSQRPTARELLDDPWLVEDSEA